MAVSSYDRHFPFFDGSAALEGAELNVLLVGQSERLKHGVDRHERMLQKGEFDICELSLSNYLVAKSRGMPFTAIPVFPRRLFSLSQMWVRAGAGIAAPKDLEGRKVGLSTFQTTLSVLAKGDLQSEYGVDWRKVAWVVAKEETVAFEPMKGVDIRLAPAGKKIGALLAAGEIDALFMPHPPKEVLDQPEKFGRLFPDAKAEELKYFRKNGFFPIMHVVAFKDAVLSAHPWLAQAVMELFARGKEVCRRYYDDPNWSRLVWGRHLFEEERRLLGADPWPYGVAQNRANLERFMGYSLDQGLMTKKLAVEELFATTTSTS